MRRMITKDAYTEEEFQQLIGRESARVELKTGASGKPLQEAMVALSNTAGGLLVIGVDDRRQLIGRPLDQATEERIHAAAAEAHNLGRYDVREIHVGTRPLVIIEVARREEGIAQTSDGRILVRKGPRNQAVVGDAVWQLLTSRTLRRFEQAASGVALDRAAHDDLNRICAAHGWQPDDVRLHDRLRERGLAGDTELTIAGALLLTDPRQTISASKFMVEIRWYDGVGPDYRRRTVVEGPLPSQIQVAADLVNTELGIDLIVIGVSRHELPRLPPVVVREAIANAVAHRSYELDQTAVVIDIRPDQVVITSPGRLPESVTIATMRQAQAARNPVVIDVLRRCGLTEDAGRGVDVMQDVMRDEMLDPPVFEAIGQFVRVTLPIRGPVTPTERAWLKDLEESGVLEPVDRLLLVHAARGDALTNARARQITGLDREQALGSLRRLRDQGFVRQHGERGGATYVLHDAIGPVAVRRLSQGEIEQMILTEAGKHPIRNEDVRTLTGLDRVDALALLSRLVERGELVRHGSRRFTTYTRSTG
jgi:ATP-dependent DNA helicase RecG